MAKSKFNYRNKNDLAFLDMLFNFTLAFAFLFLISMMLIKPEAEPIHKKGLEMKAEFIINMTWPDDNIDDIDMWVMLPDGRKVNYIAKDVDFLTLDRDDRGAQGDIYTDQNGKRVLNKLNRETVTIRAIVPGVYVISAHVFAVYPELESFQSETVLPYNAKLEIIKVNPTVSTVATSTVKLTERGQEEVFISFEVTDTGEVINIQLNPSKYKLVMPAPAYYTSTSPSQPYSDR